MYDNTPHKGDTIYYEDQRCESECGEGKNWNLYRFPVGMTYVPKQPWERLYDIEDGLRRGTIFPSLDLPFCGGGMK